MEILLLFATLIAYNVFSYMGIVAAAQLTMKKKLAIQKQLILFVIGIAAMAAALFTAFLFVPLAAIVLFAVMFFGVQSITNISAIKSAQFALIYSVIVVVLASLESYLVTALLLAK